MTDLFISQPDDMFFVGHGAQQYVEMVSITKQSSMFPYELGVIAVSENDKKRQYTLCLTEDSAKQIYEHLKGVFDK